MNLNMLWSSRSIRDHVPIRDDISRHQNMTTQRKNNPHERQSTWHRSTNWYRTTRHTPSLQDEPQPCTPRREQRHPPGWVCIHMTHRTNTFSYSHCFTPIIYLIDVDRGFVRQTQALTWILDSRQVSTSFSPLYYGCIKPCLYNST